MNKFERDMELSYRPSSSWHVLKSSSPPGVSFLRLDPLPVGLLHRKVDTINLKAIDMWFFGSGIRIVTSVFLFPIACAFGRGGGWGSRAALLKLLDVYICVRERGRESIAGIDSTPCE